MQKYIAMMKRRTALRLYGRVNAEVTWPTRYLCRCIVRTPPMIEDVEVQLTRSRGEQVGTVHARAVRLAGAEFADAVIHADESVREALDTCLPDALRACADAREG